MKLEIFPYADQIAPQLQKIDIEDIDCKVIFNLIEPGSMESIKLISLLKDYDYPKAKKIFDYMIKQEDFKLYSFQKDVLKSLEKFILPTLKSESKPVPLKEQNKVL